MGRGKKRRKRTGAGTVRTGANIGKTGVSTGAESTGAADIGTGDSTGPGTQEIGVGLVQMSNEVTIDEVALAAEADAAMATAEPMPDAAPALAAPAESWGPFVTGLVPTLRGVVFAQWQIHEVQVQELQASLTICLDQAFPGGMGGPYACWARLGMCCVGIGAYAMVQNGGKLPPLGLPRAVQQKETGTAAGTDCAH